MCRKCTLLRAGFLLILLSVVCLGPVSFATAKEVHALLIILGNDVNIRKSVEKSEGRIKEVMRLVSHHCDVHLTVMKSEDELLGSITKMTLGPRGTPRNYIQHAGNYQRYACERLSSRVTLQSRGYSAYLLQWTREYTAF